MRCYPVANSIQAAGDVTTTPVLSSAMHICSSHHTTSSCVSTFMQTLTRCYLAPYRLLGSGVEAGSWGHEYVRNLAGEISAEFQHREEQDADVQDLLDLVAQITPYHMSHNAEPDAVDLLLEVEKLDWLAQYVDDKNYMRTCLYLVSCCAYLAEPDDTAVLRTAFDLYTKCKKYVDAMRIALRMNDHGLIISTMTACEDILHKKQLAFLLARQGVLLMYEEEEEDAMEDAPQVQLLQHHTGGLLCT